VNRALQLVASGRGQGLTVRRFEEGEEEMTLCEALLLAVEALEDRGGSRQAKAARMLDKKAMKLRAKEEASVRLPAYCLCGNEKKDGALFCRMCFSVIPVKLWTAFHTAKPGHMRKCFAEIEEFVRRRDVRGPAALMDAPRERRRREPKLVERGMT